MVRDARLFHRPRQQVGDAQFLRPPLEILQVQALGLRFENPPDLPPLSLGHLSTQPILFEFRQHCVFRALEE